MVLTAIAPSTGANLDYVGRLVVHTRHMLVAPKTPFEIRRKPFKRSK